MSGNDFIGTNMLFSLCKNSTCICSKTFILKKNHFVSLKLKVVINLVYMGKTATFHVPSTVKTAFVIFKTDPVLVVNPDGRGNPVVQVRYYFTVQYS